MIRFIDLVAIVSNIPAIPNFPKKCPECGNAVFDATSLLFLGYDGHTAEFSIACPKCGFSHMRVGVSTPKPVPATVEDLLSGGEPVTAADLFGNRVPPA